MNNHLTGTRDRERKRRERERRKDQHQPTWPGAGETLKRQAKRIAEG